MVDATEVEKYDLTFDGQPALRSLLAQILTEEGASVDPRSEQGELERRSIVGGIAITYGVSLVASGTYDLIKAGVAKFCEKVPGVTVTIQSHKGRHRA